MSWSGAPASMRSRERYSPVLLPTGSSCLPATSRCASAARLKQSAEAVTLTSLLARQPPTSSGAVNPSGGWGGGTETSTTHNNDANTNRGASRWSVRHK